MARLEPLPELGPDVGRRIAWRDSQWESRSSSHLFDESLVFGRADEKEHVIELVLSCSQGSKTHVLPTKERVIELVLSCSQGSKTHVLPVVGMGGIGKTTMAQMVYNDGRVQERFDLRGWVHVSETFDLRRLTIAIYESLTRGPCEYSELSSVHDVLKQKLCGKSVFMVLDDLWNERQSFWQDLLYPLKDAESVMILVTTRSKEVARLVQTVEPLVLRSLSEEHCWLLFQHYAFGDRIIDEESSLVQVGRKIMQKCGGLPLAVKSIGCLLRSKRNMQTWLEISESEFWEYSDDNDEIFCALRLSFYRLPARLKPCFLLCVLYPKGEPFTKDDMIHLWIAHGYIQTTGCKTPERIAGEYFDELNERSLIEPDLVHLDIRERPSFWKKSPGIRGSQSIRNANNGISLLATDASYSDIISLLETSPGTTKASLAFRNFRLHDMTWELAKSLSTSLLSAVVVDGGSLYLGQNIERLPFLVGGGRQNTHRYNTYNQINGSPGIGMNPSGQKNWLIDSMDDHVNLMSVACSTGNKHVNILTIENRVSQLHNMNYLRTLMLKQCTFFHIGIHEYRYLRILVLDSCNSGCISATQYLKLLRYLHVSNCDSMFGKNLKHLTESICHLYSLEKLIVTTCWKEFSMTSCHLFSLRYLQLSVRFSDWSLHPFCQFYNLDTLCLKKCDSIADLPICIGNLMSLKRLQLIQISNIKKLDHYSFRCQSNSNKSELTKVIFPALEELEFDSLCDLQDWCGLQDSDCPKIQNITLRNCYKLRRIPYFGSVRNLIIRKLALADLQLSAYNELSQLQTLDIRYCKNLKSLMGLKNLCSLGSLYIAHCPQLIVLCKDKLPFRPQYVFIDDCPGLKEWCDEQELYYQVPKMVKISDIKWAKEYGVAYFQSCEHICLDILPEHKPELILSPDNLLPSELRLLKIGLFESSDGVPSFHRGLSTLGKLEIRGCPKLVTLMDLEELNVLHSLVIADCPSLQILAETKFPPLLASLIIEGCHKLPSLYLNSISNPSMFTELEVSDCQGLMYVEGLGCLGNLESLALLHCPLLELRELLLVIPEFVAVFLCPKLKKWCELQSIEYLESLPDPSREVNV